MAAIKVLHSTSSSFTNLHLSIILGHAKPLFNALTSGLKPHTQLPACLTRRHDTATVHSATMASPHPPSMHITVSRTRPSGERPVVPRDILARDAAILIRACASNERRSVDARVGLNLRRLLGARNGCPGPQPQKTHKYFCLPSTMTFSKYLDVPRSPTGHGLSS